MWVTNLKPDEVVLRRRRGCIGGGTFSKFLKFQLGQGSRARPCCRHQALSRQPLNIFYTYQTNSAIITAPPASTKNLLKIQVTPLWFIPQTTDFWQMDFIESALKLHLNLILTRKENQITNLNWFLGGRPVIGEVGVVGLVHHLAAHTQVTPGHLSPCFPLLVTT